MPTAPTPDPSRLSARRSATRQRILEAAAEAFAERGYHGTSVELVCERAGFTRGAFYSNYASKDDLVLELSRRHTAAMLEIIAATADREYSSPEALVRAVIEAVSELSSGRRQWILLHTEFTLHALREPEVGRAWARQEREVRRALSAQITEVCDRHGLEPLIPAETLVQTAMALMTGGLAQRLVEPRSLAAGALEQAVLPLLVAPRPDAD